MHIYLVRHTKYLNPEKLYAFHLPFFLSKEGRRHASKIGDWFVEKGQTNILIYSSPIVRALQTAEIIAHDTDSFVIVDKRLEETSCENLEGVKKPLENDWIFEEDYKNRESRDAILQRMLSIYKSVTAKNEDCILVSHGDALTLLYYHLLQKDPPEYFWDPKNEPFIVRRGEIIDIEVSNNKIQSITRNHLSIEKELLLD